MIFVNVLLLVVGFVLLIKGADLFVDGSSAVAKLLKVPTIIVGLTIVSMGTSLPEMAVSISAALRGDNAIAVSNVVGSNLFNLLVVLGVCAAIKPIVVQESIMRREYPLNLVTTLLLALLSSAAFTGVASVVTSGSFSGTDTVGTLGHASGIVFLVIFVAFLVLSVRSALSARKAAAEQEPEEGSEAPMSITKSILFIVVGIVAIKFGGDFVVDNAKVIAAAVGMSDTLIGLTVVALGTSLPELVTSIVAANKGENDLAVGNVVGSNLFNILFVLGVSTALCPIAVGLESVIDMLVLLGVSIVVYLFAITKKNIARWEGFTMVGMYIAYSVYIFLR